MKPSTFIAATLALAGLFATPVRAEETARAILIFDASGSMWGQIEGRPKIDIAREVASDLIKDRPENLELGFMAYGHRRKGDCEDIELLLAPEDASTEKLLSAVTSLIPKGKTPIYDAVLQAAEELEYTEEAASVILVTDGIETCGGDLAALGSLLFEKGIDFKTHVIGFAIGYEETVDLRTLARRTGGLYADADNAEQLASALKQAVEAVTKPVTTLTLVPIGDDGKSIISNGVTFEVFSGPGEEDPVATGNGGQFSVELDPGSYVATAKFADRTLEENVTVSEGRDTPRNFIFTAPSLTLEALLDEESDPLTDGVAWQILGKANAEGKREVVTYSYDAQPKLRIAPGDYVVQARRGNATVEKAVTFKKESKKVSVVFGAGNLQLTAALNDGGDQLSGGLAWSILGVPDEEGDREQIAYSYDDVPNFTLPAGSYLGMVKKGNASVTKQVEVTAGTLTKDHLVMGSGIIQAKALMSPGMDPHGSGGLAWSVLTEEDAEGNRKQIAYSYDDAPKFTVPSGTYVIEVKRGSASTRQDVEVHPGKSTDTTLTLNASILSANAVMTEGAAPVDAGGLAWSVLGEENSEGKREQVAYSYDNEPRFCLPVGTFLVKVKRGSATVEKEIEVVAGELNKATLDLDAGLIRIKPVDGDGELVSGKVTWSVLEEEGGKQIAYSYDKEPTFILPAGEVFIKVKMGDETAEATTTVTAGKVHEIDLEVD